MRGTTRLAALVLILAAPAVPAGDPLEGRLPAAVERAAARMGRTISPAVSGTEPEGTMVPAKGAVIASAAGQDPDGFYHWTRDSALVMDAVATLLERASDPAQVARYEAMLDDFARFSEKLQALPVAAGLGEPRFHADGTPDARPWPRPQNDGPALRALALLHARRARRTPLSVEQEAAWRRLVVADLDYVAAQWDKPCFDVWESLTGLHSATRLVQAGALEAAAPELRAWEDPKRAKLYEKTAGKILDSIEPFWNKDRRYLSSSFGPLHDGAGKPSPRPGEGLDAGVLMAVVQAGRPAGGAWSFLDDRILATLVRLEDYFANTFPINKTRPRGVGVAIGRHQGDRDHGGNPFFVLTAAYAEFHFEAARALAAAGDLEVTSLSLPFWTRAARLGGLPVPREGGVLAATAEEKERWAQALRRRGDEFLEAILLSVPPDGAMAEQFDRATRAPVSGRDRSWSYAAFVTAALAR